MKRWIFCMGAAVLLSGCATPTSSVSEVRQMQERTVTVCSPLPMEEAVQRLKQAWANCYVGGASISRVWVSAGSVPVPVPAAGGGGSFGVLVEGEPAAPTLVLRTPKRYVFLIADFASNSCPTQVTARGWNLGWQRAAEMTETWVNDPTAGGPLGACH